MVEVVAFLIIIVLQTLISGGCLWVGMCIVGESGDIRALLLASFLAALVSFVPFAGGLLALGVLLFLLSKWTTADIFPSGILIVLVARLLSFFLAIAILGVFQQL